MKGKFMRNWTLKYGPTVLISFLFYAITSTRHSRALGDIILESVGIPPWIDGTSGLHLTLVYGLIMIGIIFIIRNKFIDENYHLKGFKHFVVFVVIVSCIYFVHSGIVTMAISSVDDLNSIVLVDDAQLSYKYKDEELSEFKLEFELRNYSNSSREFQLELNFPDTRIGNINLVNENDLRYVLEAKESRLIIIKRDKNNMSLETEIDIESSFVSAERQLENIVLVDRNGIKYNIKTMPYKDIKLLWNESRNNIR